jgi:hypothetical protein
MSRRQEIAAAVQEVLAQHPFNHGRCDRNGQQCGWKGDLTHHRVHVAELIAHRVDGLLP